MRRFILTLSMFFAAVFCGSAINYPDVEYGPWVLNVNETGFTVIWTSATKNLAYVEVAPDDDTPFELCDRPRFYNLVSGRRVADSLHTVKVTGLEPGKAYRYRIYAKAVENDESAYGTDYGPERRVSARVDAVVRTLDSKADRCRFFMMNDIHNKAEKYQALAKGVEKSEFDFFLMNGDMVSYINNIEDMMRDVFNTVPELTSSIPTVYARGNHETRGREAHLFGKVCPTPTGEPYYMFRQGPVAFLVLDGGEDKPDNDIEYHDLVRYDDYRNKEAEWLKRVVESPECKSAKVRIVVIHIPPKSSGWHGEAEIARLFVPILNSADIDAMFCGHIHKYRFSEAGDSLYGCNFPIVCNPNRTRMDINVSNDKISYKITNAEAKEITNEISIK